MEEMFKIVNIESIKKESIAGADIANSFCNEENEFRNSNERELCETDPIQLPPDTTLNLNSENEELRVTNNEEESRFNEFEKQTQSNSNENELCETDPIELFPDTALNLNPGNKELRVTNNEEESRFNEFEKQTQSNSNDNELCETDPIELFPDTALNLNPGNEKLQVTNNEEESRFNEFEKQTQSNSNENELCETDPIELFPDTALNLNPGNKELRVTNNEEESRFNEFEKQTQSNSNDNELCETDPIELFPYTALNLNPGNEKLQVTNNEEESRFNEFEKQTQSNSNENELCETDPIELFQDTALNLNPGNEELRVTNNEEGNGFNEFEKRILSNSNENEICEADPIEVLPELQVTDSEEEIQSNDFEKQIQTNDSENIKTEPKQLDESLSCKVSVSFQNYKKSSYVVCNICNKILTDNYKLKKHLELHEFGNFICKECNKGFKYLSEFKRHTRSCCTLTCNICNEIFNTSQELQKHIAVHIHTNFNCLVCKEIFVQEDEFKKHMLVHNKSNLETEQSNEICNKSDSRNNEDVCGSNLKSSSDEEPSEKRKLRSNSKPSKRSLRLDSWSDEKTEKRTLRSRSITNNKRLRFDSLSDEEISEKEKILNIATRSKRSLKLNSCSDKETSKKKILPRNSLSSKRSLRLDSLNDEKSEKGTLRNNSEYSNKRLRLNSWNDEEIPEKKSLPSGKNTPRKNSSIYYKESESSEDNYKINLPSEKISTIVMASTSKFNTISTNTPQTNEPRKFNYECEECNKKFLFESGLIQHKKNYSTYNCSLCHITFPDRNGLEMHIREHNSLPENNEQSINTAKIEQKVEISDNVDEILKNGEKKQLDNKCIKCDKVFESRKKYLIHCSTYIDRNDIYKCPNCNMKFHENRFLKLHMIVCTVTQRNTKKKVVIKCVKCDKIFKRKQNYVRHCVEYMGMDEIYQCPNCGQKFHENKYLQMHLRHCSDSKNNKNEINEVEKQEENNPHTNKCIICQEIFSTRLSYLCHCEMYMGKEVHTCSKCNMKFHEYRQLESHSKICSGKVNSEINTENVDKIPKKRVIKKELLLNKCFKCEKVLANKRIYLHHIQLYKNKDEIFECSNCSEKFHENTHLEKHLKTCSDAASKNTEILVNKVKTFKQEKTKQCHTSKCEICKKVLGSKHSLLRHYNSYLGKEVYACSKCGKKFHELRYFKMHQDSCIATIKNSQNETNNDKVHKENMEMKCAKCEKVFLRRSGYLHHMRSYKFSNEIHECSNCTQKFHKIRYLKEHLKHCAGTVRTHLKNKVNKLISYKCVKCEIVIGDKQSYLDHIETYKDKDEIFECSDCNEKFHENENLKRHLSICTVRVSRNTQNEINNYIVHKQVEENKCVKCEKVFPNRDSYLRHLESYKDSDEIFECTNCTEKFHDEKYLKNHLKFCVGTIRTDINEINVNKILLQNKCVKCEKVMENRQSYLDHIETYEGQDEIFECTNCSEKFHEHKNLEKHLKICTIVTIQNDDNVHQTEENYKCMKCEKVFSNNRNYLHHLKVYKDQNEIYECYNCFMKFHNSNLFKSHLKRCIDVSTEEVKEHKKKVNKNRLLSTKCQTCGKILANRKSYLRHMQVYFGKDIYACSYCGKKFHEKALLKSHVSNHTGVVEHEWYQCNICMRNFKHKYLLQRHLETLHLVNIKKELINEPKSSFI